MLRWRRVPREVPTPIAHSRYAPCGGHFHFLLVCLSKYALDPPWPTSYEALLPRVSLHVRVFPIKKYRELALYSTVPNLLQNHLSYQKWCRFKLFTSFKNPTGFSLNNDKGYCFAYNTIPLANISQSTTAPTNINATNAMVNTNYTSTTAQMPQQLPTPVNVQIFTRYLHGYPRAEYSIDSIDSGFPLKLWWPDSQFSTKNSILAIRHPQAVKEKL